MSDEFIISASDTNGHSSRHWCRTIPQVARQIEQLVSSKKFPYRTKGDLMRHAIHRHVRWLERQGEVTSVSGQVDAIIELMRDDEMNSDFLQVFDRLAARINSHLGSGSEGEAIRLIRLIQTHIGSMPDGYWKKRYSDQLSDRFGHMIKNGKKANLGVIEDEG